MFADVSYRRKKRIKEKERRKKKKKLGYGNPRLSGSDIGRL